MKYNLIQIINAFSTFYSLHEININLLHENIKELTNYEQYKEILKDYSFDENGFSSQLSIEINNSLFSDDIMLTSDNFIYFKLNNFKRDLIFKNVDNKKLYLAFMDDFINLNVKKSNEGKHDKSRTKVNIKSKNNKKRY